MKIRNILLFVCIVNLLAVTVRAQDTVYDIFTFADPTLAEDNREMPTFTAKLIGPDTVEIGEEQKYAVEIDNKGTRLLINYVRLSIVTLDSYGKSNEIHYAEAENLDRAGYKFETNFKIVKEQLGSESEKKSLLICVFGETGKITRQPAAYFQHCSLRPLNYEGTITKNYEVITNPFSQYIDYMVITPSNGLLTNFIYGGYKGFYTYYYGGVLSVEKSDYFIPDANKYVGRIISIPRTLFMGTLTTAQKYIKGGTHSESEEPYFNKDYAQNADSYFYLVDEVPLKRHMFPFHSSMIDSERAEYLLYVPEVEQRSYFMEGRYFGTNKTVYATTETPHALTLPILAGTEKKPLISGEGAVQPSQPPAQTETEEQGTTPQVPEQPTAFPAQERKDRLLKETDILLYLGILAAAIIIVVLFGFLMKTGKLSLGGSTPKTDKPIVKTEKTAGKRCSKCGAQNEANASFCKNCGNKT